MSLLSLPGFYSAKSGSLFTLKIPVTGDSLNYGYVPLTIPQGMTVSIGGTISWTPKTDSVCLEHAEYRVFDDNGNRDTVTYYIWVNASNPTTAILKNAKPEQNSVFSISINPSSRNITIVRPDHSRAADLFIYDLSGRVIDKMIGVTANSVIWKPKSKTTGCYILMVKSGTTKFTKKFMLTW
jgi:hypothetical protein